MSSEVHYLNHLPHVRRADNLELPPLPLLFVDGYNVIGTWPRLKKRRDKVNLFREVGGMEISWVS